MNEAKATEKDPKPVVKCIHPLFQSRFPEVGWGLRMKLKINGEEKGLFFSKMKLHLVLK